jgi:hypothetical protein
VQRKVPFSRSFGGVYEGIDDHSTVLGRIGPRDWKIFQSSPDLPQMAEKQFHGLSSRHGVDMSSAKILVLLSIFFLVFFIPASVAPSTHNEGFAYLVSQNSKFGIPSCSLAFL